MAKITPQKASVRKLRTNALLLLLGLVSAPAPTSSTSSIPRSTNSRAHAYHRNSDSDAESEANSDASGSDSSSLDSSSLERRPLPLPWNPSPKIDSNGFLTETFRRTPGEWEIEANIGGRHGPRSKFYAQMHQVPITVRQVPGDGNCLFHSITVALSVATNSTHIHMNTSRRLSHGSSHGSSHGPYHGYGLDHLHHHSTILRQKAVDALSSNPRRLLFLQGNEYLRAKDLVSAAAAQYEMTGQEYCDLMRKDSYWGGGPEIVALCNVLKRPIHVYELSHVSHSETDVDSIDTDTNSSFNNHHDAHPNHNLFKIENDHDIEQDDHYDHHMEISRNQQNEHDINNESILETSPNRGKHQEQNHYPHKTTKNNYHQQSKTPSQFRLRRMACFGSPKFDRREPLHILSADSRFPDISPGKQLQSGNHFLALFPEEYMHAVEEAEKLRRRKKKGKNLGRHKSRRTAGVRGGAHGHGVSDLKNKDQKELYSFHKPLTKRKDSIRPEHKERQKNSSVWLHGILGPCRFLGRLMTPERREECSEELGAGVSATWRLMFQYWIDCMSRFFN